ncbi:MAG: ABC transporter permease [Phycisphaerales bacterium]|nr:ABC transporter permease [Phycisphaerales bacterium]
MTFLLETVKLGLANLRLQMLRSILTALGIIFGVAAVITMVAIGEGSTQEALRQIEALGARNIIVRSQPPPESQNQQGGTQRSFVNTYGITFADYDVIKANFPDADHIVPLKEVGGEILRQGLRKTSQTFGTTPDLLEVARLRIDRGRYLTEGDLEQSAVVCVIGHEVAKEFFPLEDPLGKTLRVDDTALTVVGVLAPVGLSGGAGAALVGRDLNLDIHIPLTTARAVFGDIVIRRSSGSFQGNEVQLSEVYIECPERDRVVTDSERLRRVMDVRHPALTDIGMIVPYELLENARRRAMMGQIVSGAVAAIALLVGGIGIMNIMLANVTERTREIGIRRALGATRKHIIAQFLVETSVLSCIGGLLGVGLGVGLSLALDSLVPLLPAAPLVGKFIPPDAALPTLVTGWSIIVAFVVAALTGLIFGIYPARKAALQDPIVALRHD